MFECAWIINEKCWLKFNWPRGPFRFLLYFLIFFSFFILKTVFLYIFLLLRFIFGSSSRFFVSIFILLPYLIFHPFIIINYTLSLFLVFIFDLLVESRFGFVYTFGIILILLSWFGRAIHFSMCIRISYMNSIFIFPDGFCPFLHRSYDIARQHTVWMHGLFPLLSFSFPKGETVAPLPPTISFHCELWRIYTETPMLNYSRKGKKSF